MGECVVQVSNFDIVSTLEQIRYSLTVQISYKINVKMICDIQ